MTSFQLTFTNAVSSLQLDAESGALTGSTVTLTAYDASNTVVATDTQNGDTVHTLSVSSGTNNIKYFTVSTNIDELSFSNVVWGCAT